MTDKTEIDYLVYSPNRNLAFQNGLDRTQCSRSVADGGRSVGFHQCGNNPVEEIGGYQWCGVHAREVKRRLGINDEATTVKFVVGNKGQFGSYIEKIQVIKESDKSLTVASVEGVYGNKEHYSQIIKKSGIRVYDSKSDALEAMVVILHAKINGLMNEVKRYNDEIEKIESSIKESKS